ncbi:nucleotidyltransferase family protein [Dyadobacter sp. 32]|uniref:nucleotidyltransferase family protein n=1 Tax=Dyadobacter sp. 32 TaxID=538966 RepID=UPI0011F038DF
MKKEHASVGIIILAAGNSSRLGQAKQLLQFKNKSLIRNVADEALAADVGNVIVVTGANQEAVSRELADLPVHFAHNPDWQQGMGSSIRTGLTKLLKLDQNTNSVILAVSDQPFVTSELFQNLIEAAKIEDKTIVACAYQNTMGTPVLFKNQYFDALKLLEGAEGAKKLLKKFGTDVSYVPFQQGEIDIDTMEDFEKLQQS